MEDVYSQLKALKLQEDQDMQNNLRKKLMSLAIRQGNVPEGQREYLQAKDLAEDGMGVRKKLMNRDLLFRFADGDALPGNHEEDFKKTLQDARENMSLFSGKEPPYSQAHYNYLKQRDNELLEEEVDVQKALNQRNDLIKALKGIK